MMDVFSALLEARDPALGRFRAYRLDAGTDLLGDWLVDVTYGRIGTRGRRIRHLVQDEMEAKKLVRESLRRRSTAKRRIGVSYRFCQLIDPHQWFIAAARAAGCDESEETFDAKLKEADDREANDE